MPKLGLLGAIGGFGQALQTYGSDMVRRREQALDWARREAEHQRTRAEKKEDVGEERDFQLKITGERERAADERSTAQIEAMDRRTEAERDFKKSERVERQKFDASEGAKDRAARVALERLQGSLQSARTAAEIRLRDQLQADDVHAVQYGAPDANGYAEVFVVTESGKVRRTGQRVYRPKEDEEDDKLKL